MNATSLYASTCRLIILADADDKSSWTDLFRLVPYLRQSLSCTVCGNLLKEPYTPITSACQHHVCKHCKGGRKKLKPSCTWCKDYDTYSDNLHLRILLQCYKKLCVYFMGTEVYKTLLEEEEISAGVNGGTVASSGLIDLIQEGASFTDNYKSPVGFSKSAYSILPCVYSNPNSTQSQVASTSSSTESQAGKESPNIRTISNGSSLYSVMYAGSGNKITIKRKAVEKPEPKDTTVKESKDKKIIKYKHSSKRSRIIMQQRRNRPRRVNTSSKRRGCRCGNATATPGKLTCCGQRCPCYVESKPCTECKCKGCRNPHRPDGMKVRPHIPELENIPLSLSTATESHSSCSGSMDSLNPDPLGMEAIEETLNYNSDLKSSNIKVYNSQLQEVSPSLPATLLMDDDLPESDADDDMSSPPDWSCSDAADSAPSPLTADPDDQDDIEVDV